MDVSERAMSETDIHGLFKGPYYPGQHPCDGLLRVSVLNLVLIRASEYEDITLGRVKCRSWRCPVSWVLGVNNMRSALSS